MEGARKALLTATDLPPFSHHAWSSTWHRAVQPKAPTFKPFSSARRREDLWPASLAPMIQSCQLLAGEGVGFRLDSAGQFRPLVVIMERCKDMQTKGKSISFSLSQNPPSRPLLCTYCPKRNGDTAPFLRACGPNPPTTRREAAGETPRFPSLTPAASLWRGKPASLCCPPCGWKLASHGPQPCS